MKLCIVLSVTLVHYTTLIYLHITSYGSVNVVQLRKLSLCLAIPLTLSENLGEHESDGIVFHNFHHIVIGQLLFI